MEQVKIIGIIGIFLILTNLNAQDFLNLDFEYGVHKAQPRKWAVEGEGKQYYAKLDSSVANKGKKSLHITLKNGEVYTFLSLPGKLVAGKSIEIEGHIKFNSSDSLVSMFAFRDPSGGKPNVSQPIKENNNEWTFISHKASIPDSYSSDRLLVALIAMGTGDFYFDNVKIRIDGREYGNGPPDFRGPTEREIAALDKLAVPIRSLNPDDDLKDLVPLDRILGNANIVALGENSHGSSTIYRFKLRMVKYMVEKLGFSVFALESPVVEADRINDCVVDDEGTLDDVIRDLVYPSWQTQEMIDIVQWIRSYNRTTDKKVMFKGFDMQNGLSALEAVNDFAKANDRALSAKLDELRNLYDDAMEGKQRWDEVLQKSETISTYLGSKNVSEYAGVEARGLARTKHYLDIFVQGISSRDKSENAKSRDEHMALNIDWLVRNNEGRKIILSADNTHVTKASGKMGSFLNDRFDDGYIVFGFTYNKGTYSAYGPEKYYDVHPSHVGSYEYFFSKCRFKNFLLDLRANDGIPILDNAAGFRSIGSRPQETTQFTEIELKKHFDVIVYIEKSAHTIPMTE